MGWFSRKKDRKKEKPNLEEVDNKVESSNEIKQNSEPLEEEKESIADELVTNLSITSRKYVSCTGVDYNVLLRFKQRNNRDKHNY
jgi:hypothetical protein